MKIKKFNENYEQNKKLVKVTFTKCLTIPLDDIKNTQQYQYWTKEEDDKHSAITFGIEDYINGHADELNYNWELTDGLGNTITNEEEFDNQMKFNL